MTPVFEPSARSLNVGRTMALVFELLSARWLWIAALIIALGLGPSAAIRQWLHVAYHPGSHDLRAFVTHEGAALAASLFDYLASLSVIAVSLSQSGHRSAPANAVFAAIRALPLLVPVWVFGHATTFWDAWWSWDVHAPRSLEQLTWDVWTNLIAETALSVGLLVSVAVLPAVVLAEKRGLATSLRAAWRLMRGSRWKVFGLYLVVQLPGFLAGLAYLSYRIGTARGGVHQATNPYLDWSLTVVAYATAALWAVSLAAIYLELNRDRGGVALMHVADQFN
ncbi:MAG TPA: hypothetical protein VGI95_05130 [Caulobacteraceae bacterium]|jgi:hypothetical protein